MKLSIRGTPHAFTLVPLLNTFLYSQFLMLGRKASGSGWIWALRVVDSFHLSRTVETLSRMSTVTLRRPLERILLGLEQLSQGQNIFGVGRLRRSHGVFINPPFCQTWRPACGKPFKVFFPHVQDSVEPLECAALEVLPFQMFVLDPAHLTLPQLA